MLESEEATRLSSGRPEPIRRNPDLLDKGDPSPMTEGTTFGERRRKYLDDIRGNPMLIGSRLLDHKMQQTNERIRRTQ